MTIRRTAIRIVAPALSVMIAAGPVAAQQQPAPAPPTAAEIAAAEAELAAAEAALREAETEARIAAAEAAREEAEAEAAEATAAAEAARAEAEEIISEAEQLISAPTPTPTQAFGVPVELPRRRSAWRTTGGLSMMGVGALFTYAAFEEGIEDFDFEDQGIQEHVYRRYPNVLGWASGYRMVGRGRHERRCRQRLARRRTGIQVVRLVA